MNAVISYLLGMVTAIVIYSGYAKDIPLPVAIAIGFILIVVAICHYINTHEGAFE